MNFNHSELTSEEMVDATCRVEIQGFHQEFKHFVLIGFGKDDKSRLTLLTIAPLPDVHRALLLLQCAYFNTVTQAPEEMVRESELEVYSDPRLEDIIETLQEYKDEKLF